MDVTDPLACYDGGRQWLAAGDTVAALRLLRAAAPRIAAAELLLRDHAAKGTGPLPANRLALLARARQRLGDPDVAYGQGLQLLPASWKAIPVPLFPWLAADVGDPAERHPSRERLLQAAEAGHARAMFWLSRLAGWDPHGTGPLEAEAWLRRAAEAGDVAALEDRAHEGEDAPPASPLFQDHLRWLARAAEAGSPWAQQALGLRLLAGDGLACDLDAARRWLAEAGKQGAPRALAAWEHWFGKATRAPVLPAGLRVHAERASRHGPAALARYADLLPPEEAREVYLEAAEGGSVYAVERLAALHEHDPLKAMRWQLGAAEMGSAAARAELEAWFGDLASAWVAHAEAHARQEPIDRPAWKEALRRAMGLSALVPFAAARAALLLGREAEANHQCLAHMAYATPADAYRAGAGWVLADAERRLVLAPPVSPSPALAAALASAAADLERAAGAGDPRSAFELALGRERGTLPAGEVRAWYELAAAADYLPAVAKLALEPGPELLPRLRRVAALVLDAGRTAPHPGDAPTLRLEAPGLAPGLGP